MYEDGAGYSMKIDLLYGRKGLEVHLPNPIRVHVIRKHPMPLLPDPERAVRDALEAPVACPSFQELAQGKRNACILMCDITRPVPNGLILPPLVESLTRAGIAKKNILILIATGLHRPAQGAELEEIVGSREILRTVRIENHFARDKDAHEDLGTTSGGIPIMIDRRFLGADLKIVTGLVEPHFMAGYSGGRKVVAPGVAYQDTILMFHSAKILEHCKAVNCIIEGNPLHKEQVEIVRAIGGVVAVNVVIDEERRLGYVNFGKVETSHAQAVAFMRKYAEVRVPRRFKTILTTSAGHPLDKTYYQTVKGMVGVMDILEPGGTIIIASECSEGMGSPEFLESQRLLCQIGPERFMSLLESRDKARIDEWETEMLLKPLRVGSIQLYSTGLSESDRKHVFVETVPSVEEAVVASVRASGDAEIAVVPEGPYVIPLYGG
jgi:nickel-dependent lactate racemase